MEEVTQTTPSSAADEQSIVPEENAATPTTETPPATSAPESTQTAAEPSASDELEGLRTELARVRTERTATLEAVRLGIDPAVIPYVLRIAEFPADGTEEGIQKALQKVLEDVPAFKASMSGSRPEIRIGAKEPEQNNTEDALARAFGNRKKQ